MEDLTRDVLRMPSTIIRYKERKKQEGARNLDLRSLKQLAVFDHWIVVENEFPYDKIALVHHLLVPKAFFAQEWEMPGEARRELTAVRKWADFMRYDVVMENTLHNRTIKGQFHLHLIKYKEVMSI